MKSFESKLINRLLDKYEKSILSKGGTQTNRGIKLTTKDPVLESYNRMDSYKFADENDGIIRNLEVEGFINAKFNNESFDFLTLNLNNVNQLYEYVKRKKPSEELEKINQIIITYHFNNFVDDFIEYISTCIQVEYDYPKKYFSDAAQLELILNVFSHLFNISTEMKKRDFSVKYLGDSKLFEKIEKKIIKIIKDFDLQEYQSDNEILASYNIVKNTSYALIKHKLTFQLNKTIINLDELSFEFALSDEMIDNMEIIHSNVTKIITVENLTSFYALNDPQAIIIYLAGFHNHTKQNLLKKIYHEYPNASYLHFGDIDAGGFWIFSNLVEKTGISFKPFRMNKEELIEQKNNLKVLSENDRRRLSKMLEDKRFEIFKDTILYMLETNSKLEQEILD